MPNEIQQRTISDFGEQWQRYQDNEGFQTGAGFIRAGVEPCRG